MRREPNAPAVPAYAGEVFGRKRSAEAEAAPATTPDPGMITTGKGRPTPKRREAEQRNRQPMIGAARLPANATKEQRKAAREAQRQASSAERLKSREALLTGDERHLPAQHRGPARRWARDYVDARRNLGDYLFPVAIVVLGAGLVPVAAIRPFTLLAVPLLYLYLLVVLVDAYLLSRRINRLTFERFGAQAAGAGRYGALRSMQIRRFRLPRPQVARGQHPE
jgi:Protein of unknown function (DUF3043)